MMSDEAIAKATGRDRDQWRAWLDARGAGGMPHADIVRLVRAEGPGSWWAQMVTVEYERMIGRRIVGQRCDGAFSASASRTLPGNMDAVLDRWQSAMAGRAMFDGTAADNEPSVSRTEKWRYWRVALEDGSRVVATVSAKGPDKSVLTVNHDKLASSDAVDRWKGVWKAELGAL